MSWCSDVTWTIDSDRVLNVVMKLARGHAAYELSEPKFEEATAVAYSPFGLLSADSRAAFESLPSPSMFPEVGSRAAGEARGE